jgi:RNA polymerase sigma-70 factor (ECF subfamily)
MEHETGGTAGAGADRAILFEGLFKAHFKNLHSYALMLVKDEAVAEEIVQQVFYKLWEQQGLVGDEPVAGYLYRAVHNTCLNHLKHAKVRNTYSAHVHRTAATHTPDTDHAALRELQQKIDEVLGELPEQCRTVFQLSRYEGLGYRDIAAKLGISVKTVEAQMTKALKIMRTRLAAWLPVLVPLLITFKSLLP